MPNLVLSRPSPMQCKEVAGSSLQFPARYMHDMIILCISALEFIRGPS